MIIKSYEGVQTDFYLVNHAPISVGRSTNSVIRSLEITVEDRHAQVFESAGRYYLQDLGTESGTFVKISLRQALKVGTLIEMGSFMFKVKAMDKAFQAIQLSCYHIVNKTLNDLTIIFKNNEPYTFGRRASNHFSSEDEHMSGQHAQMYFSKGEFYMEDNQSTNGTWVRLSDRRVVSEPY